MQKTLFRAISCAMLPALAAGCAASMHDTVARGDLERAGAMLARDGAAADARDGFGRTPLFHAVNYGRLDAMDLLVRHGAGVNAADGTGLTPLHAAAMYGRREEAQWLLEHGADPAARDHFGDTALHTAAIFGGGRAMSVLLAHGVDLTAKNKEGLTALDLARRHCHEKEAAYLERRMPKGNG